MSPKAAIQRVARALGGMISWWLVRHCGKGRRDFLDRAAPPFFATSTLRPCWSPCESRVPKRWSPQFKMKRYIRRQFLSEPVSMYDATPWPPQLSASGLSPAAHRPCCDLRIDRQPNARGTIATPRPSRVAPAPRPVMQSTSLAGRIVLAVEDEPLVALDREGTAGRPGSKTPTKRRTSHFAPELEKGSTP